MKLSLLFLLPVASLAFAPVRVPSAVPMRSLVVTRNEVDDACEKITDKTEDVLDKADSMVLGRAMRFVDHAPILVTLKALAEKAGSSKWGIDASASAFTGLSTALAVPTWCFNIWALVAVAQIASVAKSALAEDQNELSQKDISTTALSNFLAARTIGSSCALGDTALTAVVSGYALRKNANDGAVTIHSAAMQLVSSFTTVLTVLGTISWAAAQLPFMDGRTELVSGLGIAAYYIMATRGGNGTVKKAVNAGIIGGILYARLAEGVSFTLSTANLFSGITLVGTAYVAYEAINRLRKAVMD